MSRYLIRPTEDNPDIVVRTRTGDRRVGGNGMLERIRWRAEQTGEEIASGWMALHRSGRERVRQNGRGPDLSSDDLAKANWPLARPPYLLETSRPGIFAVGDVRCGNVKRFASAVGEGSIAVAFVHQVLRQ
jgi:thioredoxin reductase (NADPH)